MNKDIEKFINLDSNDLLSKMKDNDKLELLNHIKNYHCRLRDKLDIDPNYNFGIEIEFEMLYNLDDFYEEFEQKYKDWQYEYEISIGDWGGEVISPILKDSKKTWQQISDICKLIRINGGMVNSKCGAHNHVDVTYLKNTKNFLNFVRFWKAYEDIIYHFGTGRATNMRQRTDLSALPITPYWNNLDLEKIKKDSLNTIVGKLLFGENYENSDYQVKGMGVNIYNVKSLKRKFEGNTVELRYTNGTIDANTWQNNVNVNAHIFKYALNHNFDKEKMESLKTKNTSYHDIMKSIEKTNLNKALDFADTIFDKNIDKVYFLKQYLFKNKEDLDLKKLVKSK